MKYKEEIKIDVDHYHRKDMWVSHLGVEAFCDIGYAPSLHLSCPVTTPQLREGVREVLDKHHCIPTMPKHTVFTPSSQFRIQHEFHKKRLAGSLKAVRAIRNGHSCKNKKNFKDEPSADETFAIGVCNALLQHVDATRPKPKLQDFSSEGSNMERSNNTVEVHVSENSESLGSQTLPTVRKIEDQVEERKTSSFRRSLIEALSAKKLPKKNRRSTAQEIHNRRQMALASDLEEHFKKLGARWHGKELTQTFAPLFPPLMAVRAVLCEVAKDPSRSSSELQVKTPMHTGNLDKLAELRHVYIWADNQGRLLLHGSIKHVNGDWFMIADEESVSLKWMKEKRPFVVTATHHFKHTAHDEHVYGKTLQVPCNDGRTLILRPPERHYQIFDSWIADLTGPDYEPRSGHSGEKRATFSERPYGWKIAPRRCTDRGGRSLVIVEVTLDGRAAELGLEPGMTLLELNGKDMTDCPFPLLRKILNHAPLPLHALFRGQKLLPTDQVTVPSLNEKGQWGFRHRGMTITDVSDHASEFGFQKFDEIVEINGEPCYAGLGSDKVAARLLTKAKNSTESVVFGVRRAHKIELPEDMKIFDHPCLFQYPAPLRLPHTATEPILIAKSWSDPQWYCHGWFSHGGLVMTLKPFCLDQCFGMYIEDVYKISAVEEINDPLTEEESEVPEENQIEFVSHENSAEKSQESMPMMLCDSMSCMGGRAHCQKRVVMVDKKEDVEITTVSDLDRVTDPDVVMVQMTAALSDHDEPQITGMQELARKRAPKGWQIRVGIRIASSRQVQLQDDVDPEQELVLGCVTKWQADLLRMRLGRAAKQVNDDHRAAQREESLHQDYDTVLRHWNNMTVTKTIGEDTKQVGGQLSYHFWGTRKIVKTLVLREHPLAKMFKKNPTVSRAERYSILCTALQAAFFVMTFFFNVECQMVPKPAACVTKNSAWHEFLVPSWGTLFATLNGLFWTVPIPLLLIGLFKKWPVHEILTDEEKQDKIFWWRVKQCLGWIIVVGLNAFFIYWLVIFTNQISVKVVVKWLNSAWVSLLHRFVTAPAVRSLIFSLIAITTRYTFCFDSLVILFPHVVPQETLTINPFYKQDSDDHSSDSGASDDGDYDMGFGGVA